MGWENFDVEDDDGGVERGEKAMEERSGMVQMWCNQF